MYIDSFLLTFKRPSYFFAHVAGAITVLTLFTLLERLNYNDWNDNDEDNDDDSQRPADCKMNIY